MKKILSIIIFLFISQTLFAASLDYKGLEKLSKNNTFMDGKGNPYSAEKIVNKKMESNKGHNIPQSTCFTKFFDKPAASKIDEIIIKFIFYKLRKLVEQ